MMPLSIKQAEAFVRKTNGARWDNYTIVIHRPNPAAEYSKAGRFDKKAGVWGYETRVDLDDKGIWNIPKRRV
jgi:hypothetical protein